MANDFGPTVGGIITQVYVMSAFVRFGRQHRDVLSDDFLRGIAKYPHRSRVDVLNSASFINGHHHIGDVRQDGRKSPLTYIWRSSAPYGFALKHGALFPFL